MSSPSSSRKRKASMKDYESDQELIGGMVEAFKEGEGSAEAFLDAVKEFCDDNEPTEDEEPEMVSMVHMAHMFQHVLRDTIGYKKAALVAMKRSVPSFVTRVPTYSDPILYYEELVHVCTKLATAEEKDYSLASMTDFAFECRDHVRALIKEKTRFEQLATDQEPSFLGCIKVANENYERKLAEQKEMFETEIAALKQAAVIN